MLKHVFLKDLVYGAPELTKHTLSHRSSRSLTLGARLDKFHLQNGKTEGQGARDLLKSGHVRAAVKNWVV